MKYIQTDKCPFCDEELPLLSIERDTECRGLNCNYTFYKRPTEDEGQRLFSALKSFGEKLIFKLPNGDFCIGVLEKVEPFKIEKLTNIIRYEALHVLHNGFVDMINVPATLVQINTTEPLNVKEYEFIQNITSYDAYCKLLMKYGFTNTYCRLSTQQQINQILDEYPDGIGLERNQIFEIKCFSNKTHLLSPVVINGRLMGFLVFGCTLLVDDDIIIPKDIEDRISEVELSDAIANAKYNAITKDQLGELKNKVQSILLTICDFIENVYLSKRRLNESYFFNYLIEEVLKLPQVMTQQIFTKKLNAAMEQISKFARTQFAFLLLNDEISKEQYKLMGSSHYSSDIINYSIISDFIDNFLKQDMIQYFSNTELAALKVKMGKILSINEPLHATLVPIKIYRREGILILVNRTIRIGNNWKRDGSPAFRSFLVALRRELEVGLGLLNHEMKQKTVLSNISHEIINPLDKIKGRIEFMQSHIKYIKSEEYDSRFKLTLDDLYYKSLFMEQRTKDIIRGAQLSELVPLELKWTDIYELVKPNVYMLRSKAKTKNLHIYYQELDTIKIPLFKLNEEYFEGALFNILENAVKYSNEHTTIEIKMKVDYERKIYILAISNFGIGVREDEKDSIFELEKRGSNTTIDGGGLGRGLWIAKGSLRRHIIISNKMEFYIDLKLTQLDDPTIFEIQIPFVFRKED